MKYRLSDLAEVCSSKRIYAKEYRSSGIPFYRGKEIIAKSEGHKIANLLFISEDRYNTLLTKYGAPEENDILISAVGTIGKVYIVDRRDIPFYFKDGNLIRICNYNYSLIDPYYLYYLLKSSCGQNVIKKIEIGSTQKAITIKELSHIVLDIPSLQKQQEISAMFKKIDAQASVNRRLNDNLLELNDKIFSKIFYNEKKFVEAQKIANIKIGKTPPRKEKKWFLEKGIQWVSISDMKSNVPFINKSKERISLEAIKKFNINKVKPKTVILSFKLTIGRVKIADSTITTNEAIAEFNDAKLPYQFLYTYLKGFNFETLGNTSSIAKSLNSKIIKKMLIMVPSKINLDRYIFFASPIFNLIKKKQIENSVLNNLKRILLQKYF